MTFSGIARAGELTVYTSLEEDDAKVYLDAFAKVEPGIKVNMLRLSTGDLGARMLAEKAIPSTISYGLGGYPDGRSPHYGNAGGL